jgi:signal transduction histidine kinase
MKRIFLFALVVWLIASCLSAAVPRQSDPLHELNALKQQFKKDLRSGIGLFMMGILLLIAALACIIFFYVIIKLHNRPYRSLLYLGLFTLLYGIRILSETPITWYIFDNHVFLYYISPFVTYIIPIPFILLIKQFTGWGWRSSVRWVLVLQCAYTGAGVFTDLVSGVPGTVLVPYNNIIVILDVLVGYINLYFSQLIRNLKGRFFKIGIIVIAVTIINENLVSARLVPWRFHFERLLFFILICFLAALVIYHILRQQKQLQQQLMQADKMIALGTLVSGVAHEINNPNNFILLNSEILSRTWQDIEPILKKHAETDEDFLLAGVPYTEAKENIPGFISDIHQGAERIKNIVQNLKDYARPTAAAPAAPAEDIDIAAVIQSAVNLAANHIKKYTQNFSVEIQEGLPPVKGNSQQLEQVMINLILNSLQALPDKTKSAAVTAEYLENENQILIRVKDEGTGILPKDLDQVFNPFFTTRRDTGGLGLGLSICATIIKDHRGQIQLESRVGEGTTVLITLPATFTFASGGSEPFWKRVPTPPKTFDNKKLLEVQEPFLEKVPGRRRHRRTR